MTTATLTDVHWSQRGLCRDEPRLFDAATTSDMFTALDICRRCPVLAQCDEWRRQHPDPYRTGVVAGIYHGK